MSGEDDGIPRFGLRDPALQPRSGRECARPGAQRRLSRGSRQQLRRLGLCRRGALSAGAVPRLARQAERFCLISVGEVTVTLDRTPGAGGRNQQFALACALELANHPGERLTVLSAGSDGIDGNTQSAGAIADPTTVERARAFGFDPEQSLAEVQCLPALYRHRRLGGHRPHRPQPARPAPADLRIRMSLGRTRAKSWHAPKALFRWTRTSGRNSGTLIDLFSSPAVLCRTTNSIRDRVFSLVLSLRAGSIQEPRRDELRK